MIDELPVNTQAFSHFVASDRKHPRNPICVFILKGAPDVIQTPCDLAGATPGAGPHSQEGSFSMDNWRCLFVEDSMDIFSHPGYIYGILSSFEIGLCHFISFSFLSAFP